MVSDLKTFTNKGCKIAGGKKVCFGANFAWLRRIFLVSVFLFLFNGLFSLKSNVQNFFKFSESLGKISRKKWSQIWKLLLIKFLRFFLLHLFTPFKHLFPPASWSPMSNNFRLSESLEKSNGRKWSPIWKLLLKKGVKSQRNKKLFLANFALLAGFFWYRCYYSHRSRFALSPICGIFWRKLHFITSRFK